MNKEMNKDWQPYFSKVIITLNTVKNNEVLQLNDSMLDEVQTVLAVGDSASNYTKVGQEVLLDIDKMQVQEKQEDGSYKLRIKIEPIEFNDQKCAIVEDRMFKARR